jgi:tRNA-binding protein
LRVSYNGNTLAFQAKARGSIPLTRSMATYEDFLKLDIRAGQIITVEDFPEAKKPAYRLQIDLGPEIGIKKSCAQITKNYSKDQLKGKRVVCVVNFPPKNIGPEISEVLTLGVPDENHECVLLSPDKDIPLGGRVY